MASAGDIQPIEGDAIQFDRAEFATAEPGGVECSSCQQPIPDSYFELNGKLLCPRCAQAVNAAFTGGSGFARLMKAGLYGVGAAVAGAVLIYLFRRITGLEAAIISILAGFMVGSAIRRGSGYRGGRVYQLLALFLTYSALSWSYLPEVTTEIFGQVEKARQEKLAADGAKNAANAPKAAAPKAGDPAPAEPKAKAKNAAPAEKVDADDAPVGPLWMVVLLIGLAVFLVGFTYCAPIIGIVSEMPRGLIGALIVFWGLQQAWKLAAKVSVDVRGPFRVGESGAETHG